MCASRRAVPYGYLTSGGLTQNATLHQTPATHAVKVFEKTLGVYECTTFSSFVVSRTAALANKSALERVSSGRPGWARRLVIVNRQGLPLPPTLPASNDWVAYSADPVNEVTGWPPSLVIIVSERFTVPWLFAGVGGAAVSFRGSLGFSMQLCEHK